MQACPNIAVVVVTHNSASQVPATLAAVEAQLKEGDELVVVDNASSDDTVPAVRASPARAVVVETGRNAGFAEAANAGVQASRAPLVVLLNPDAVPAAGCLTALRRPHAEQPSWGAWQALVTMDGGARINTRGGVVHYLGIAWAGGCGEPVGTVQRAHSEVGFASGAALCVRRDSWERLGGFDPRYFMYCEDVDLSLRLRLAGMTVGVVMDARVEHDYEFAKGARKWFLLERNRLWTVLSDYPAPLLALLVPALVAFELALLPTAARDGWLRAKLHAQATVLSELPQIAARRREVQRTRAISASAFAGGLSASLDNPFLARSAHARPVVTAQRAYWWAVLRLLWLLAGRPTRKR